MINDEYDFKSREKSSKSINDYARDTESEREDEDIYNHYIREMEKTKAERSKESKENTN